ncbi:hypothetical protein ABZ930_27220 [Streptomyces sp. NPDC046716]|uniref:hypothetical protein n=1 Tax=Streptomyces sp. NPDC046716 TaxID=3157093 RepID=UPI0033FE29EA
MDEQESAVALGEILDLREWCTNVRQIAALGDLVTLLGQCAGTPGSHLWFQGD